MPAAPPAADPVALSFYERDTLTVARELLGKLLVRERNGEYRWGRLVEVEAYQGPEDLAAHSSRGRTARTEVMFGPAGHAYVYFIYGMYHCLNFVTRPEGIPQAVLVRALDPGPGVGRCSGPGLVCQALDIDRSLNGRALLPSSGAAADRTGNLYLLDDGCRPSRIFTTRRIGVDYSGKWSRKPWRFCIDSPGLSRPLPRQPASSAAGRSRRRADRDQPAGRAAGAGRRPPLPRP